MSDPKLIRIVCPNLTCMRIIAVAASARGRLVRCRRCGTTVKIPRLQDSTAQAEAKG